MRWTVHLDGGPRRVNHAAVALNGRVYSFGGYTSEEKYARNELIDVHVLNTRTFRWHKVLPTLSRKRKSTDSRRSFAVSIIDSIPQVTVESTGSENNLRDQRTLFDVTAADVQCPTTSASFSVASPSSLHACRSFRQTPPSRRSIPYSFTLAMPMMQDHMGRRRSVAELHPLGQLRSYRPPVDEDIDNNHNADGSSKTTQNSVDATADLSLRSNDSGFAETDVNEEHEFSLIHRFRRQRAATVDVGATMGRSLTDSTDVEIGDNNLRQQLHAFAVNIRQIQGSEKDENASSPDEVVDQMARDFDELGAMDIDNYYYDDAPALLPNAIANNGHNDAEASDGEEEEDLDEDDDSYMSDIVEDDFEDFGDEDSNDEEVANRAYEPSANDDDSNFIDGNEDDEVYDDFDFNYHNLANVGVAARLQRMQADAVRRRRLSQQPEPVAPAQRRVLDLLQLPAYQRRRANSLFARINAGANSRRRSRQYVAPFHRYGHTVVAYQGKAYLWGGRSDEHTASTALHEFDPETCRWSVVRFAAGSFEPPARDGHSAVVYGDSMYIFGGFEERYHRFSQETYAFHFPTSTWKLLRTEGPSPLHRDFHTACVLGDGKMYVFGGRSDETGQFISDNDVYCAKLWCLDLKQLRWSEVRTIGNAPSGRRSHSVWTYNNRMYIFGGYSGEKGVHFDDLYVFDPERAHWSIVRPSCGVGTPPSARRRQCTIAVGDKVFLFGGTMPNSTKKRLMDLADLYVLDYAPSLATLSSEAMIRYGLNERYDHILPRSVQLEIQYMHRSNSISQLDKR